MGWGLGFRVWGLQARIKGLGFTGWGGGLRVYAQAFRV